MSELRELYQEVILDHYRKPRNFGYLTGANREAEGQNPLCGDQVTIFVQVEDGVVRDLKFKGQGCAISTASASLMTEALKGKTVEQAEKIFHHFHELVTSSDADALPPPELGKLAVLAGVREFPVRVKCATLAWHTLNAALHGSEEPVTTE